jgi:AraC family transcriptional regulator
MGEKMNAQVIQLDPIRVVMLRHTGSYDGIPEAFDRLWQWVEAQSVPAQRTIGMYWDNAEHTPESQLRSAACVEVPESYSIQNAGRLSLELKEISGGSYATIRHTGPYDDLERVWSRLTDYIESDLGRTVGRGPAFEVYVNDPSDTPAHQLVTELYMPVQ